MFVEAQHPTKVDLDFDQFVNLGIEKLVAAGCRSVGLISLRGPWKPSVGAEGGEAQSLFAESFSKYCRDHDVLTSNRWIKTADEFVQGRGPQENFGYSQFLRIWQLSKRPDGLIVYPNSCAVGVITGVLEKRVNVPQDLKLVLHRHREIDYLCPLPVSFIYSSTEEIAKALLQQTVRQFRGEMPTQVIVSFSANA